MIAPRLFSLIRGAAVLGAALVVLVSPKYAAAQAPVPTAEFAPYIGVRQITNGLQGTPPAGISLKYGYFVSLLGSILMIVGSARRSSMSERPRKPPGVL